jgi:uncharacterized protein YdbL (DUF1318 family)
MMRSVAFKSAALLCLASCLLMAACVTINVYFPAAAAEQAADKIIDDIWGSQGRPPADKDNKRSALPLPPGDVVLAAARSALDLLVPAAQAAQADLNVSTPAIRQLTQSMEERHARLKQYYDSGAIGLTRDGLVEVRDQNLVPLAERNSLRKLVADENADRANLYREIATANGHPEWEMDIRSTFAERWASKAAPGWYYQDKNGNWQRK